MLWTKDDFLKFTSQNMLPLFNACLLFLVKALVGGNTTTVVKDNFSLRNLQNANSEVEKLVIAASNYNQTTDSQLKQLAMNGVDRNHLIVARMHLLNILFLQLRPKSS